VDNQEWARNMGFEAFKRYDDHLVTLATGTLTLSITFRDKLAPANAQYLWLLTACWLLLSVSILTSLWSLQAQGTVFLQVSNRSSSPIQSKAWHFFNFVSGSTFGLGIWCLVWFGVANNH